MAALNLVGQIDDQQVKDAMVLHYSPPLYLPSQLRAKPSQLEHRFCVSLEIL
jgi:hypothetical protein